MRTAGPERYACTCGRAMFMCIAITHEPRESIIVCGHRRGVQEDAGPTTDLRYLLQVRRGGRGGAEEDTLGWAQRGEYIRSKEAAQLRLLCTVV